MYPAPSIIFFTVLSGTGYGLLFLIGLFAAFGRLPADPWYGLCGLALALTLVFAGLVSSTLHLGHPERAWRALSQWRSSWLSREGVAAVASFPPALGLGWSWLGGSLPSPLLGALTALLAAVTVACTAMIYASLKPIARWHNAFTLPLYLLHALGGGGLVFIWLNGLWGQAHFGTPLAVALLAAAWALQLLYWMRMESLTSAATPESATGLGDRGPVRLLEAPHTEENYLLKEMAFAIGRKHARKLRRLAVLFGLALPVASLLLAGQLAMPLLSGIFHLLGLVSGFLGLLLQRWLFFAEARHTVTLYYGSASA